MEIISLSKEYAMQNAELILDLEQFWQEIGDGVWTLENLLLTIPGKWKLSHVALEHDKIIGYQVGSLYEEDSVYLNKIVVNLDIRRKGCGRGLLKQFLEKSLKIGREQVKFKVRTENPAANFYDRLGFLKKAELDYSRPNGVTSFFYDTSIKDVLPNLQ